MYSLLTVADNPEDEFLISEEVEDQWIHVMMCLIREWPPHWTQNLSLSLVNNNLILSYLYTSPIQVICMTNDNDKIWSSSWGGHSLINTSSHGSLISTSSEYFKSSSGIICNVSKGTIYFIYFTFRIVFVWTNFLSGNGSHQSVRWLIRAWAPLWTVSSKKFAKQ